MQFIFVSQLSNMFALVKGLIIASAALAASGYNLGPTDVVFHLYSRRNPQLSEPLLPSMPSIMMSSLDVSLGTVITIHSNGDSVGGNFNAFQIPAHLQANDVNVLAVDWSVGCDSYTTGLANAPQVGRVIADFINLLSGTFGYDARLVRIVGVGLGGHIAGIAAKNINGGLPHIIAIDPSLHGWSFHPDRLSPNDADVVEVLHATSGLLGYDYPLGDLDFYPNGGIQQLGCIDISCSQTYAYAYYAESITRDVSGGSRFIGTRCESYEDAINLRCNGDRDVHFGGGEVKQGVSGIYSFVTNLVQPFARG